MKIAVLKLVRKLLIVFAKVFSVLKIVHELVGMAIDKVDEMIGNKKKKDKKNAK